MQIPVAEYLHKRILFFSGQMELLGQISHLLGSRGGESPASGERQEEATRRLQEKVSLS
jgi:hypothetical protein